MRRGRGGCDGRRRARAVPVRCRGSACTSKCSATRSCPPRRRAPRGAARRRWRARRWRRRSARRRPGARPRRTTRRTSASGRVCSASTATRRSNVRVSAGSALTPPWILLGIAMRSNSVRPASIAVTVLPCDAISADSAPSRAPNSRMRSFSSTMPICWNTARRLSASRWVAEICRIIGRLLRCAAHPQLRVKSMLRAASRI